MFVQVLPFCIFVRLTIALTDMLLSSYYVCIGYSSTPGRVGGIWKRILPGGDVSENG